MFAPVDAYTSSLFNSYIEMIEQYSSSSEVVDTDNSMNDNAEVIVPIEPNDNFLRFISSATNITNTSLIDESYKRKQQCYIDNFTNILFKSGNTVELGYMTMFDAIKFAEALAGENLNDFFGLLLISKSGNEIINPFHPLISLALEKKFKQEPNFWVFNEKFRVVVFSIKSSDSNIFTEFSEKARFDDIFDNIALQMIAYQESTSIITEEKIQDNVGDLIQLAKTGVFRDINISKTLRYKSNENIEFKGLNFAAMVPVHVAIRGVAFPWYGSVVAYNGSPNNNDIDTYGVQLSPFMSANVGYRGGEFEKDETVFDSVCCGKYDKTKPEGLYTLNRSNFDSALNSYGLEAGWMIYKNECIKASLEVYASFIELDKLKPKKLTYKEQWLLDNTNATELDYLAHLRTKHSQPTLEVERDSAIPTQTSSHPNDSVLNQVFNGIHDDSQDAARMIFSMDFASAVDAGIQAIIEAGVRDAEAENVPAKRERQKRNPVKRKRRKRNPETGMLE